MRCDCDREQPVGRLPYGCSERATQPGRQEDSRAVVQALRQVKRSERVADVLDEVGLVGSMVSLDVRWRCAVSTAPMVLSICRLSISAAEW